MRKKKQCVRLLQSWQWNFGAIAIVMCWIGLVMFIQKFPKIGIYVVMFNSILRTFFEFFIVFLLFIIAFGLGFFVLIQNQVSLVSTLFVFSCDALFFLAGECQMGTSSIFVSQQMLHDFLKV